MRLASLLVQELSPQALRGTSADEELNGRLVVTRRLVERLARDPAVEQMVAVAAEDDLVPGVRGLPLEELPGWLGGDVAWLEPARHYWWQPWLIRRAVGGRFPIVTLAHGIGYGHQILPLIASLLCPQRPGDAVVAPSRATADVLAAQCAGLAGALALPVGPPRIEVVPYGLPPVPEVPHEAARAALGWSGGPPVALFLGRLSRHDKADFAALFEAAARVAAEGVLFRLVVAGAARAGKAAALRDLAVGFGLGERVEVRPNVSEAEKHLLYAGCDLFVSPSNATSESFGLTLVEAMSHGRPVLCTSWSGYREIVRHEVDGLLVDTWWDDRGARGQELPLALGRREGLSDHVAVDVPGLAAGLARLLRDRALRRRLGESGRRRAAERFALPETVRRLVALCEAGRSEARRAPDGPPPAELGVAAAFGRYASQLWSTRTELRPDPASDPARSLDRGERDRLAPAAALARAAAGRGGADERAAFELVRRGLLEARGRPERARQVGANGRAAAAGA